MEERVKIVCAALADRDALAVILVRNGYTARQGKERRSGKNSYTYYVEFWREP